jgi:Asp-tRNA(Asn)/Glu-tRNA(Gln) amidotransferase C subunit
VSAANSKQRMNLAKLTSSDNEIERLHKHVETINGYIYNLRTFNFAVMGEMHSE